MTALSISNIPVRQDDYSRFCLNYLHKASGGKKQNQPSNWLRNQQTIDLIDYLESEESIEKIPPIKTKQGIGTFAVKELVYAYAMWISAKFNITVIRAYDSLVNTSATRNVLIENPTLSPEQKRHIQEIVNDIYAKQDIHYQTTYHNIKTHFKVGTYKELKQTQYPDVCKFLGVKPIHGELLSKEISTQGVPLLNPYQPMPPTTNKDYYTACSRLCSIKSWAKANHSNVMVDDIEAVERCLTSVWTEIDECVFRIEPAIGFLKRWINK